MTTASTPATKRDPDAMAASALGQMVTRLFTSGGGDLSYGSLKSGFRDAMKRDPLDSLAVVVIGGSYLFYLAEKGKNPKVTSFYDALVFITTCASVGYSDIFARTDSGKAIASFVMTFGPALSASALDPPAGEKPEPTVTVSPESLEVQKAILAKLEAIHEQLAAGAAPAR